MLGLLETAKGERLMQLPTDPENRRFTEAIIHPMRMRELALEVARAAGEDLESILRAVRNLGPARGRSGSGLSRR